MEPGAQTSTVSICAPIFTMTPQKSPVPIARVIISLTENKKQTPWPLFRKRTVPTERPPLVGEVSANFSGQRVSRGQRNESPRPLSSIL
jgi:hypothetical protein